MTRIALTAAALALLLAPAAQATRLRAVGICGPDRCQASARASLLKELEAVVDGHHPSEPRPPAEEFYVVDMLSTRGVLGKAAFLPKAGILYWRPKPEDERWIALSSRASALMRAGAAGAAPYDPPLEPVLGIAANAAKASGGGGSGWQVAFGALALAAGGLVGVLFVRRRQRA